MPAAGLGRSPGGAHDASPTRAPPRRSTLRAWWTISGLTVPPIRGREGALRGDGRPAAMDLHGWLGLRRVPRDDGDPRRGIVVLPLGSNRRHLPGHIQGLFFLDTGSCPVWCCASTTSASTRSPWHRICRSARTFVGLLRPPPRAPEGSIAIFRRRFVGNGMVERIVLRNYDLEPRRDHRDAAGRRPTWPTCSR